MGESDLGWWRPVHVLLVLGLGLPFSLLLRLGGTVVHLVVWGPTIGALSQRHPGKVTPLALRHARPKRWSTLLAAVHFHGCRLEDGRDAYEWIGGANGSLVLSARRWSSLTTNAIKSCKEDGVRIHPG